MGDKISHRQRSGSSRHKRPQGQFPKGDNFEGRFRPARKSHRKDEQKRINVNDWTGN